MLIGFAGPMFSEKTARLIEQYNNSKVDTLMVKPISDTRHKTTPGFASGYVCSRNGERAPAFETDNLTEIELDSSLKELYIDEAWLYPIESLRHISNLSTKIDIYCTFLSSLANGDYHPSIDCLFHVCDKIHHLKAKCFTCGKSASKTADISKSSDKIRIGDAGYAPMCSAHYYLNLVGKTLANKESEC